MIQLSKPVIITRETSGSPYGTKYLGKVGFAQFNPNKISNKKFPFIVHFIDGTNTELFSAGELENL